MSDYVKTVDFAAKDALATGDPLKVVKGTEINTEFVNIATAVATKADKNSPSFTGVPLAPTPSGSTATQIATVAYVNGVATSSIPIGSIVMWGGTAGNYPAGWRLCDGTSYARSDGNGNITTPDLRNRFIVAMGSSYSERSTGGSTTHTHTATNAGAHNHGGVTASHTLTEAQIPSHTHATYGGESGSYQPGGAYGASTSNNGNAYGTTAATGGGQGHTHGLQSDGDHSHSINAGQNVPPYIALAFIMKV
jgi:microcystin-dependent protein